MNTRRINTFLLTLILIIILLAFAPVKIEAHIPTIAGDKHATPGTSLHLKDIVISRAIYQKLTKKTPESYISFAGEKGQTLDLEIGIPKIPRLRDFRPNISLFYFPEGDNISTSEKREIEVMELVTKDANPTLFHEPFTNTSSWILNKTIITLPITGKYHLLSYHPETETGKMWVAIGRQERFGPEDWGTLPASIVEVRLFHEADTPVTKRHTISLLLLGLIATIFIIITIYFLKGKIKAFSRLLSNCFKPREL